MVYRDELFKCFQEMFSQRMRVWDVDEDRVCRTDGAHLGNSEGGGGEPCSPGRGTILLAAHIQTCRSFWSFLLSRFGVLVTKSFSMLLRDNQLQNENASRNENIHVPGGKKNAVTLSG